MRRRVAGTRRPGFAPPVGEPCGGFGGQPLPPHVAVVGERAVGGDDVLAQHLRGPRRRGLPRRARGHPRGGRAPADEAADRGAGDPRALPAGRRRRGAAPRVRERRRALRAGRDGRRRGAAGVPALDGAHGVRRHRPHDGEPPEHRHPGGDVLVLQPDRLDARGRFLHHRRGAVRAREVVPRPRHAGPHPELVPRTPRAAAARRRTSPGTGRGGPGRARGCTRRPSRRCPRAPSRASTTTRCTRSSPRTPRPGTRPRTRTPARPGPRHGGQGSVPAAPVRGSTPRPPVAPRRPAVPLQEPVRTWKGPCRR